MCEFERGTGAREIYPSLDQMSKVRSKDSKRFSGRNRKFKRFFRPKTGDLQKKRSSSQKRHEIRCQSTKNTNLGLDLHSSSPEPVNFSRAQSSLGGAQFSFGGSTAPVCPPVAPGLREKPSLESNQRQHEMDVLSGSIFNRSALQKKQCGVSSLSNRPLEDNKLHN